MSPKTLEWLRELELSWWPEIVGAVIGTALAIFLLASVLL